MTFLTQTLVQGAVGFAVGAGTNDLAIRWIFRTVYKKKPVIGKGIQDIISTELMSPERIISRLSTPDVRETLERHIREVFDRYCLEEYSSSVNELAAGNPKAEKALNDGIQGISARLADDLVYYYTAMDSRIQFVREVFGKVDGVLGPLMPDLLGLVVRLPELHARLQEEIGRALHGCASRPIGRLDRIVDPSVRIFLASVCANAFTEYLGRSLPVLMRQLKLWDVIQDSIAAFDMKEIEVVTRRIINAELRGVTLWGGIIGMCVGVSQSVVLWLLK